MHHEQIHATQVSFDRLTVPGRIDPKLFDRGRDLPTHPDRSRAIDTLDAGHCARIRGLEASR